VSGPTNTQFAVAVHALTMLANLSAEPLSSERISGSVGSNPVYVRRVLGQLREAGVVASRPGVNGGWELLADPAAVRLGDVWRVIHADAPVLGVHATPDCPVGQEITRTLADIDRRAARALEAELDDVTIADVMAGVPAFV
jgi:Rrf2 family protein